MQGTNTVTGQLTEACKIAATKIEAWDADSDTLHLVIRKRPCGFEVDCFPSGPEPSLEELMVPDVMSGAV